MTPLYNLPRGRTRDRARTPDAGDYLAAESAALLASFESDTADCELCGETYEPGEVDTGFCPGCEDFADGL